MKLLFSIILLTLIVSQHSCFAQLYETPRIAPDKLIEFNNNKIITVSYMLDGNVRKPTYYFNGQQWKDLNVDTMPTIHPYDSKAVISEFSNSIFITGQYHLWEYSGQDWIKHAIFDSLYHLRRFEQIIELHDSSLLITAKTYFITRSDGNIVFFNAVQNELLKFKNGEFTILYSSKTTKESDPSLFGSILQLKKQAHGRYSYLTNIHSGSKHVFELVLFETEGSIVEKYTVPTLDDRYKNAEVEFLDYLFDSKGSLFFLTTSKEELFKDSTGSFRDTVFFAGIVEVTRNREVKYYNENIGIQPSWYKSESFDIDDEDNIWFMYNYRKRDDWDGRNFPSLYKLNSNRESVTEYLIEDVFKNSRIFSGGDTTGKIGIYGEHRLIKCNSFRGSIFITSNYPLIEFYPKGIPPTSIKEIAAEKAFVYPHPVPEGKNAQLETQALLGIRNGVKVVIQDLRGSLIKEYMYFLDSENYSISLNTDGLIRGTYVVSIFSNSNRLLLQTNFIKE